MKLYATTRQVPDKPYIHMGYISASGITGIIGGDSPDLSYETGSLAVPFVLIGAILYLFYRVFWRD